MPLSYRAILQTRKYTYSPIATLQGRYVNPGHSTLTAWSSNLSHTLMIVGPPLTMFKSQVFTPDPHQYSLGTTLRLPQET